jgi:hypothetical protein
VPDTYTPPDPEKRTSQGILTQKDGALRPHLDIRVNPNHGLYAFFRKKLDPSSQAVTYDTVDGNTVDDVVSGMLRSQISLPSKLLVFI